MILYEGRPEDVSGRLAREIRTYDFLDKLGISYQRTDHERADTMEACNAIDAVLNVVICKNLFLCNRQKTAFYLLMMPGGKKFKTKELSAQINSARLSFAAEIPGYRAWSCEHYGPDERQGTQRTAADRRGYTEG